MRYKQQTLFSHFKSSPPSSPERPKRKGRKQDATRRVEDSEVERAESESSDVVEVRPSPSKKASILQNDGPQEDSDSSDVGRIKFESKASSSSRMSSTISSDVSDRENVPVSSPHKRARVSDSDNSDDGSREERVIPTRSKARRQLQQSNSSDEDSPPKKSRLTKRKASPMSDEDEDVLDGIDEDSEQGAA